MNFLCDDFLVAVRVRDAWRSLAGRPGFSVVVLLTLGLGIGATTTIVSFTYALLFRPYPYEAPDRLVRVQTVATNTAAPGRTVRCATSKTIAGGRPGLPTSAPTRCSTLGC